MVAKRYNHDSYKKVGSEIVDFTNRYTEDEIRLIKTKGKQEVKGRVQMPVSDLGKLLDTVSSGL